MLYLVGLKLFHMFSCESSGRCLSSIFKDKLFCPPSRKVKIRFFGVVFVCLLNHRPWWFNLAFLFISPEKARRIDVFRLVKVRVSAFSGVHSEVSSHWTLANFFTKNQKIRMFRVERYEFCLFFVSVRGYMAKLWGGRSAFLPKKSRLVGLYLLGTSRIHLRKSPFPRISSAEYDISIMEKGGVEVS